MSDSKPEQDQGDTENNEKHEKALEDTFPASDPPASTGTTGPGGDRKPES